MKSPTLQTYSELQQAFDHFNDRLFDGQLPACLITLQREKACFAYFSFQRFVNEDNGFTDEIAMNPRLFAVVPIVETLSSMCHEQCHLWQFHFGKPGRSRYHNDEWAAKMESIGLMPSTTGRPGGKRTGDSMSDYPIEGGKFLQACEELLTTDFRLSWYDRFPNVQQAEAAQHSVAMQLGSHVGGGSTAAQRIPAISQLLERAREPKEQSSEAAQESAGSGQAIENRSNRVKYRCECKHQVWGKPGLMIRCEECMELMQMT